MGRCQGGFCSPRVHELISRELGIPMEDIPLDKDGSFIITGKTKA
jgi:glycerol-3-phosphate dehydrogenase